jgi:hypothetical protein
VLAAGPRAVLSHRPRDRKRAGNPASPHRPADDEMTLHHGIPVTTASRTLLDLAQGYRVTRITWRRLYENDATLAAQLRALTAPHQARAPTPAARAPAASPGR